MESEEWEERKIVDIEKGGKYRKDENISERSFEQRNPHHKQNGSGERPR